MLNRKISMFLGLVVVLGLMAGCDKATMDKVIKADHRIANAVDKTEQFTWEMFQRGTIEKDSYLAINGALAEINTLGRDFHARARTYESFDISAKADLLKLSDDLRTIVKQKIDDGGLRIKNEDARRQWRLVADNIFASWNILVELIEQAKELAAC